MRVCSFRSYKEGVGLGLESQHYLTLDKSLQSTLSRCNNINLKVSAKDIAKGESVRYAERNITKNGVETAKEDPRNIDMDFSSSTVDLLIKLYISIT